MTTKYNRPAGAYAGQAGLANATKYQDDATASPKRAISSAKVDGDFNYLVEALNGIDAASGSRASIAERLNVCLNADGTLKVSVAGTLDEFTLLNGPTALQRVDNSTVRLVGGDYRGVLMLNRRVQLVVGGQSLYGDVASVAFTGGNTLLEMVDIVDASGALALVSADPTTIAYGPLTTGAKGNAPRATDALKIAGFRLADAGGDLGLTAPGASTPAARVTADGLVGLAPQSVTPSALSNAVLGMLLPSGMMAPYAGAVAPAGWEMCYGQAVSRVTYSALFAAIGTTFGAGDGSTTFNLPDLRGRSVFGLDNMGGTAASRVTSAVCGIAGATLGAAGGSQAMQQHTHAVTDPGHIHGFQTFAAVGNMGGSGQGVATGSNTTNTYSATTGITLANTGTGSSQNMPPAVMLNYIIKV